MNTGSRHSGGSPAGRKDMTMPHVFCSTKYPEYINDLKLLGIDVIETSPCGSLPRPVCRHADMLSCFIDAHTAVLHKSQSTALEKIRPLGMNAQSSTIELGGVYPGDIALNCLVMNGVAYCRFDSADETVFDFARRLGKGLTVCNVRQGYACCSVLKLSETAAITADRGLFRALTENGADVLMISPGSIRLDGYGCGFIGGASGLISDKTVAFCGDLHTHPDSESIRDFLAKHRMDYICLGDGALTDIGGIRLCK